MNNKKMVMVIDLERCIGCQTCAVGCHVDHSLKNDQYWCRIEPLKGNFLYKPVGVYPKLEMNFIPKQCNHCSTPACLEACPVKAITKTTGGAVIIDQDKCIGCGTCASECPYDIPVIDEEASKSSKCTLCYDRLDSGEKPFCVQSCPAGARFCGDINNEKESISKFIKSRNGYRLLEEKKTEPGLYYLPIRKKQAQN